MKIAVTSQNFRTVTPHAGKTRRFLIYSVEEGQKPVEIDRLDLPKDMSFCNFTGEQHPIDGVDVVLSASFGAGFDRKLAKRSIQASITTQADPLAAISEFLEKGPMLPDLDHHDHDHDHKHEHDHGHEEGGCSCGHHH